MILYHQTANSFAKFDLSKARPGSFGVGVYFYTEKPTDVDIHGVICDVQLSNPMREGKKLVADEKWEEMSHVVEQLILHDCGEEVSIPLLGGSDIRNFQLLCDIYAGNVEDPDWTEFLSEFRRVTRCDGYVAHDFVMCFDVDRIAIVGKFGDEKYPSHMKIREMVYGENPKKFTILSYGYIDGRWYVIANSRGRCPIAYVEAKAEDPDLYDGYEKGFENLEIGYIDKTAIQEINFGPKEISHLGDDRESLAFDILSKKFWGWSHDVAGCDYMAYTTPWGLDIDEGKQYSEEEILQKDVIPFIRWINETNKKND